MPPPNQQNGNNNSTGGFVPGYNSMQMQAGMVPPAIQPTMPFGPPPAAASAMLLQQAMAMQYITPAMSNIYGGVTPAMSGMFTPNMGAPRMGRGHMAHQRAVEEMNSIVGGVSAGAGLAGRLGGGLAAGMLGGPLGYMAYEGLGIGQGLQRAVGSVFEPLVAQRTRALHFQNQSTNFITSGSGLSSTGQGLSMTAAQQVATSVGRMADSGQFRRDTGGMFNRADMDRITRLSGQLGMLDQSQSADQMIREIGKISRAVSSFMKIAEEPDLQRAMQQMGRLRTMGFSAMEMPIAASNARTFARMAGVSIDQAMGGAERGAGFFQQAGLSGASGFTAGLGAMGAARQAAQTMSTRQLNMAGGQDGVQNAFLQASANAQTIDAFLPAMVTRRGGRLAIDQNAVQDMLTGRGNVGDLMRHGAANIRGLGGREAATELITRRRELQDELSAGLSPEQQILLPLMQARMVQRQMGGTMAGALRTMGLDEQTAQTLIQSASNPEFMRGIRQQMTQSARERGVNRREVVRDRDTLSGRLRSMYERNVESPVSALSASITRPVNDYLAEEQDREEALNMQGDGPARIVGGSRLGSRVTQASARDLMRNDPARAAALAQQALTGTQLGVRSEDETAATVAQIPLLRMLYGARGFGITRAGRGGDTTRSAIIDNADTETRLRETLGLGAARSATEINRLGEEQVALGSMLSNQGGTPEQRLQRARQATRGTGVTGQSANEMLAQAAVAVQGYVSSRRSFGGLIRHEATQTGLKQAVTASLQARGYSASQISAAVNSPEFLQQAAADARAMASPEERDTFDVLASAGLQTDAALQGQTADQLTNIANDSRESAADLLGMNDYINSTDEEKRSVLGLLSGRGEEADLRRQILAAKLMIRSDDRTTRERGQAELNRLRNDSDGEIFTRAEAAVDGQLQGLTDATIDDMAARVDGKSVAQANELITQASTHAQKAEGADISRAYQDVLGGRGAGVYTAAGGGAAGARALRESGTRATSRSVQRLIDEGASDADIANAIEGGARSQLDETSGPTAVGAGTSSDEGEATATTEAMMAAISEGFENFPGAIGRLDEASQRLYETADRLADAAGLARIVGGQQAATGGGFGVR